MPLLFLQLSPRMHLIMPHQIELLPPALPLPSPTLLPCSAYSTIGNDSFSTVSLSRYYCCCLSLSLSAAVYSASFAVAETRTQDLFSHLYVCTGREGRGGELEHRGRSSRVCKFFSKNSLRDNGFSMSHTSLPTSLLTSLPRHTQHNSSNLHSLPLPSLRTAATITSIPPSPTPPVALCFWGMIDGKSQ